MKIVHVSRTVFASTLALACASASSFAQTNEVTSEPVGFTTISLVQGLGLFGLNMVETPSFQGTANLATDPGNDIVLTGGTDALNALDPSANYYVQITDSTNSGLLADIASYDAIASTITVAGSALASLDADFSAVIRKHWTLASVFGADDASVTVQGGSAESADLIWVFQGDGSIKKYFFFIDAFGFSPSGWREVDAGTGDRSNTILYFTDGYVLQRRGATDADGVRLLGAVNTRDTTFEILQGINLVGNFYPVSGTASNLGTVFGTTSGSLKVQGGSAESADLIWIFQPDASFKKYFFFIDAFGFQPEGWREAGGDATDMSGVELPFGAAYVLQRRGSSTELVYENPIN